MQATLDGYGLAQMPLCQVEPHLQSGALVEVLRDWSEPLRGLSSLLSQPPPTDRRIPGRGGSPPALFLTNRPATKNASDTKSLDPLLLFAVHSPFLPERGR